MVFRISLIESQNALRHFSNNQQLLGQTLERLSSGLKLNRSADDPSDFSISEGLSTQIRGLAQASGNGQDALNLTSTAESALGDITDLLQRVRELGIEAANQTLTQIDRVNIQEELTELSEAIDQIARNTQFNGINLLDGSLSSSRGSETGFIELLRTDQVGTLEQTDLLRIVEPGDIVAFNEVIDLVTSIKADHFVQEVRLRLVDPAVPLIPIFGPNTDIFLDTAISDDDPVEQPAGPISFLRGAGFDAITIIVTDNGNPIAGIEINVADITLTDINKTAAFKVATSRSAITEDNGFVVQFGSNEGQTLRLDLESATAASLGVEALRLIDPSAPDNEVASLVLAENIIFTAGDAIDRVSALRAKIGGFQQRIEEGLSNLSVTRENLLSSRSILRDTDLTSETILLARSQILVEVGAAVLTQANVTSKETILDLL